MKSKLRGQTLIAAAALGLLLVSGCLKRGASEPEAAEPAAGGETLSQTEPTEEVTTPAAPLPSDLEGEPVSDATP